LNTAKRLGTGRASSQLRPLPTKQERRSNEDDRPRRSLVPFYGYLAFGLVAVVVFYRLPASLQNQAFDLVGLSGVAAIVVGTRLNRPSSSKAWLLMAAGQLLFVLGDIFWTIYEVVLHRESPFPSLADVAYLGGYVPLVAGLVLVVGARRPGRDLWSLTDGAMVAIAAAVGSWIFLMAPLAMQSGETALGTVVSLAYPTADVLLIAVAASVAFTAETKTVSYWLIGASLLAMIAADTLYIPATLSETYSTGSPIDSGWLVAYVLWGAAALHPSMRKLSEPTTGSEHMRFSRGRLASEGIAVSSIPVMFLIQTVRGEPRYSVVVVLATTFAALLVIGRKARLVASLDTAALHDPLTGLPNRRLLLDRLGQAFRSAERTGKPVGVIFLDLGGFKSINDRFGHEAGDDALITVGGRIEREVRASDTVARFGGDEFVVVAEGLEWVQAEVLVERLRSAVSAPLEVRGSWVEIQVDIGVAVEHLPSGSDDVTALLNTADRAMYRAKAAARDR
jgi:diguanylate cyclase